MVVLEESDKKSIQVPHLTRRVLGHISHSEELRPIVREEPVGCLQLHLHIDYEPASIYRVYLSN